MRSEAKFLKTTPEAFRTSGTKRRVLGPFFTRRSILAPTWRGWLLMLLMGLAAGTVFIRGLYPFLAVNDPVHGGVLVVEGWACDSTMRAAAEEFKKGHYDKLYVVGGPIERGAPMSEYDSFATLGATTLIAIGIPAEAVQGVPSPSVPQDRTYTEGRSLSRWWEVNGGAPSQLHLVSEGAHARRSRLMFKMALGDEIKIGITAAPPRSYNPERWWASSAGFRTVISELIAYTYARVLFRP